MDPAPPAPQPTYSAPIPTAPYARKPPSPQHIPILIAPAINHAFREVIRLTPTDMNAEAIKTTPYELTLVTRGVPQTASDGVAAWSYEKRRQAQQILDYMCLGSTSVARNNDFLQLYKVSMVVIVRNAPLGAPGLAGVTRACQALDLESYYVNIQSPHQLIRDLPDIICHLNAHVIRLHRQQNADTGVPRAANILVACDTGNDMSAALVAAYIMAVFDVSLEMAVQFITLQRFCTMLDENLKRMLQTWQDLLRAKAIVAAQSRQVARDNSSPRIQVKRRVDVMMDSSVNGNGTPCELDADRFIGRSNFAPFIDAE